MTIEVIVLVWFLVRGTVLGTKIEDLVVIEVIETVTVKLSAVLELGDCAGVPSGLDGPAVNVVGTTTVDTGIVGVAAAQVPGKVTVGP